MYEPYNVDILLCMFYAAEAMLSLTACFYLLFRRANAIAPDITPPVRLRRWTAALLGASTLSHLWYLPLFYLTSVEDIMMTNFIGALLDFLTVFPMSIAVLFVMLQDRRRPLWPICLMMAPLIAGIVECIITRSNTIVPVLYVYFLVLIIGLLIYMVRATRQYGRWLRDNFADLEHKEVWQSIVVLAVILLAFGLYVFEVQTPFYYYVVRLDVFILICFLVWRVETLSDLKKEECTAASSEVETSMPPLSETEGRTLPKTATDRIGPLLLRHCEDTQLYLQHDLTVLQLATAIGTNRFYLSQYFSRQQTTYNDYINGLRINHFVSLYQKTVTAHQHISVKQLAQESGFRSYSTFSKVFKQSMGKNVTTWMHEL